VRKEDAGPASAKAISGRTVLRLIDGLPFGYLIGALTMILSGKRRQRLGDLAVGTVVTRASARPYTPARRSLLQTAYPAIWLAAAIAVVLVVGHGGDPGLAQLDQMCKRATTAEAELGSAATTDQMLSVRTALINDLMATRPTSHKEYKAGTALIRDKAMEMEVLRAGQPEAARSLSHNHHRELADLGLKHC
jgi:hypothetical protein